MESSIFLMISTQLKMKDRLGREIDYLRLSVTDNCNLRCIYCMDEESQGFLEECNRITDEEILRIVRCSAELGIRKIRITGGEPLVREGVVNLIGEINKIQGIEEIYLTTNGILLSENLEKLVENGLKGVNISLDSLKSEKFRSLTRVGNLQKVLESIDKAIDCKIKVKLNTVIVDEINKDEILEFVNLTIEHPIDIRFIELMPIGIGKEHRGVSNEEIFKIITDSYRNISEYGKYKNGGPAQYMRIPESKGKIGFISAVSSCFCKECNRIRITADGFLKQCLNYDYGVNLRDLMRKNITDKELKGIIEENIYRKPENHSFDVKKNHEEIRLMNQIGG